MRDASCSGCLAAVAILAILPSWSQAVIIRSVDGTGNITPPTTAGGAPANVTGWANVGSVGNGSAVYIGNGWALTASHINRSTPFKFGGIDYSADQVVQLHEPANSSAVDLLMIHLTVAPPLPSLALASSTPPVGSEVTMIGYGANRDTAVTDYQVTFNSSTSTYTWTPVTHGPFNYSGYLYASGTTKRWGTNTVSGAVQSINIGYGNTLVFPTVFDATGGTGNNEGMLADGDSGGAAFVGASTLAGILDAKATFQNQPNGTAIYGNASDMIDIASYAPQILALVPEPSSVLVLGGVLVSALMGRRRRTARSD